MEISVIIVNYNVRHFLEQCLSSLFIALKDIPSEVFVVDNNSADGSCSMVQARFPAARLIRNTTNRGFSAANNQAIEIATGRYILLLNPDTVLPEDSLSTCLEFMDKTPDAGAAGLRMIDGRGRYLPESKRGLPTPAAAFFRISGIYKLFPRSDFFNHYYHGNLDSSVVNEIEILTGAFMFIRRETLQKTGGLDESFFMYGEDIDLSYRISLAGYKNYYLPDPAIIHYKGESTRRSDINYVIHFYRSMIIFAAKHLKERGSGLFMALIRFAVLLRGLLSLIARGVRLIIPPLAEGIAVYLLLLAASKWWGNYRFNDPAYFPSLYTNYILPAYILVWIVSMKIWGAYRERGEPVSVVKGIFSGTLFILIVYALLPVHLRFSRAVIIIGTLIITSLSLITRIVLWKIGLLKLTGLPGKSRRVLIASGIEEYLKIIRIMDESNLKYSLTGRVTPFENDPDPHLGTLYNLDEVIRINQPEEIIFSSADIQAGQIIEAINKLSGSRIGKKIARTDSSFVIGSISPSKNGEIYSLKIDAKKELQ